MYSSIIKDNFTQFLQAVLSITTTIVLSITTTIVNYITSKIAIGVIIAGCVYFFVKRLDREDINVDNNTYM